MWTKPYKNKKIGWLFLLALSQISCQFFIGASEADLTEDTQVRCQDQTDNDGDSRTDCSDDSCLPFCLVAVCGDADVDDQEECDDGNATNGDGCDSNCVLEDASTLFVRCDARTVDGNGTRANPFLAAVTALNDPSVTAQIAFLEGSNCKESLDLTRDVKLFGLGPLTQQAPILDGGASPALEISTADITVIVRHLSLTSNQNDGTVNFFGEVSGTRLGLFAVELQNTSSLSNASALDCNLKKTAQLMLDQVVVRNSPAGGLRLRGKCQALLSNSRWENNGSATSTRGAIFVDDDATFALLQSTFINNHAEVVRDTIVTNSLTGQCLVSGALVDTSNNDKLGTNEYFDKECVVSFSATETFDTPGIGNISNDPKLSEPPFFELSPSSPARNAGDPDPQAIALPFDPIEIFGVDPFSHDIFGRARLTPTHMGANQTP
jgi:cysteine-rich repeat protein